MLSALLSPSCIWDEPQVCCARENIFIILRCIYHALQAGASWGARCTIAACIARLKSPAPPQAAAMPACRAISKHNSMPPNAHTTPDMHACM